MRVLLDEHLPHRLRRHLPAHHVRTVQQEGWSSLKNGELLRRAHARGFEVFVTADRNLQFQQNLVGSDLAVIVLVARSNRFDDLLPLMPAVASAIDEAQPGEVRQVVAP